MSTKSCKVDQLDEGVIRNGLTVETNKMLAKLSVYERVGSTNDEVMRQLPGVREGFVVCVANSQTSGRGRNGRAWVSPANANIYMSIGFHVENLEVCSIGGLSLACGVVIARFLSDLGVDAQLKWPNDILVGGKKLAGILIESRIKAGSASLIIGLGVNVKMPAHEAKPIDQPWVDLDYLLMKAGKSAQRNELVTSLIESVLGACTAFMQTGFSTFAADWSKYEVLSGREVMVQTDKGEIKVSVLGISDDFALKVTDGSHESLFYAADIKVKLK